MEWKSLTCSALSFVSWLATLSAWDTCKASSCHFFLQRSPPQPRQSPRPAGCIPLLLVTSLPGPRESWVHQLLPAESALAALDVLWGSPWPLKADPPAVCAHHPRTGSVGHTSVSLALVSGRAGRCHYSSSSWLLPEL